MGGKPAAEGSGPSGGGPGLLTVALRLSVIHEPARGVAQLGRARTPVTPGQGGKRPHAEGVGGQGPRVSPAGAAAGNATQRRRPLWPGRTGHF